MKFCYGKLALCIAVVAAMCICSCSADTVVVKPDEMNGWVVATQSATPGGAPHPSFRMAGPGSAPAGTGAFHFDTEQITGADPLQKIYLGTNNHSGVALNEITSFKYYTYLHRRGYDGGGGWPDGQPPIVEIITDSGAFTQQRRFVFKPWGFAGGHSVAKDTWQEWDMMADYASPRWQMIGSNGTTNCSGNWSWVKGRYGAVSPMHFATPIVGDYKDGYDPSFRYGNESGTSISMRVGSGRAQDWMWNQEQAKWESVGWWRESCWIDGYADKLVIGINGVETVYDFERGNAMTVGIGPGSCRDSIIAAAKDNFFVVVFGKVLDSPAPTGNDFYLDDGSGKKIRVVAGNAVSPGEFWRAKGTLEWNATTSRYDLTSDPYSIDILN